MDKKKKKPFCRLGQRSKYRRFKTTTAKINLTMFNANGRLKRYNNIIGIYLNEKKINKNMSELRCGVRQIISNGFWRRCYTFSAESEGNATKRQCCSRFTTVSRKFVVCSKILRKLRNNAEARRAHFDSVSLARRTCVYFAGLKTFNRVAINVFFRHFVRVVVLRYGFHAYESRAIRTDGKKPRRTGHGGRVLEYAAFDALAPFSMRYIYVNAFAKKPTDVSGTGVSFTIVIPFFGFWALRVFSARP